MSAGYALLGGLLGGGLVVFTLALVTKRTLQAEVEQTVAEATGSAEARAVLARDARIVSDKLRGYATTYATDLATRTAQHTLASEYGLTPDRIARLERLAARYN
jgi:hypothetical protein